MVWAIWWERNKRIFHHNLSDIDMVLQNLERSIYEVVNASHSKVQCNPIVSNWDSIVIHEWKCIHIPIIWSHNSLNQGVQAELQCIGIHLA